MDGHQAREGLGRQVTRSAGTTNPGQCPGHDLFDLGGDLDPHPLEPLEGVLVHSVLLALHTVGRATAGLGQ